uniref:Uncharacterized protein LOC100182234 n=1 Tax=Phallusia mammillata TaxID=59560 RepID=A0A6F9DIC5_9ASCI|nr:uncharacterized protein LOC100182234 [Phallusia mammillata]
MEKNGVSSTDIIHTSNKICGMQTPEETKSLLKSLPDSPATNKVRRKKTLQRGIAFHGEENSDNREENADEFIATDNNIFPSPVAITQEEALRETCCHMTRQNSRQQLINSLNAINNETPEDAHAVVNGVTSDCGNPVRRREVEKPPRLQKQASRDRISTQFTKQVNNTCSDSNNGHVNGTLQRESSTECLDSMGVDVHEFLVKALQSNPRDRSILLKLEHDMVKFVNNKQIEFMRFPEMTSYHRMLVHRVAAYFGMDHNIDAKGTSVIINKTKSTRLPDTKFSEHILSASELNAAQEDMRRRSILKRMQNCQSLDHTNVLENNKALSHEDWKNYKQRSFEERENNYEKIRARIFKNQGADNGRFHKEVRSKDKERVLAQWKKRPWSSTDLGSLPGRNQPTPTGMNESGLTAKSSSFSGITVLSRHTNNDGGSLSSSTSSVFVDQSQPYNGSATEEWSDNHHSASNNAKPFYQNVGNPYVNLDGYPILYSSDAANIPGYQTRPVPLQYPHMQPYTVPQPSMSPYGIVNPDVEPPVLHQRPPNGPVIQAQVSSETTTTNSNSGTPLHVYHPAVYPPYPQAPVHLLYYPSGQAHQVSASKPTETDKQSYSHAAHLDKANTEMQSLTLQTNNSEEWDSSNADNKEVSAGDQVHSSKSDCPVVDVADLKPTTSRPETSVNRKNAKEISDGSSSIQETSQNMISNTAAPNTAPVLTDNTKPIYNQVPANAVPPIHAGPGSVAFYTPNDANFVKAGHSVLARSHPLMSQPHVYSTNVMRPPVCEANVHILPGEQSNDYCAHQTPGVINYNYMSSPSPQPVYYVLPNNTNQIQSYQNLPQHQLPNNMHINSPIVYSPMPQGYMAPHFPMQSPSYPFQVGGLGEGSKYSVPSSGNSVSSNLETGANSLQANKSCNVMDEVYPMSVMCHETGINCPMLNKFAARHSAKIVQFESKGDSDDIYLLFPSLHLATNAINALETERQSSTENSPKFHLSHIQDVNHRNDVVSQVREINNVKI